MTAAPRVTLVHRTAYSYARPVRLGPHWLRLHPQPVPNQKPVDFAVVIDPAPQRLDWMQDPLGNHVGRFTLPGPTDHLSIAVTLGIDLTPRNAFDFVLDDSAVTWPFAYAPDDAAALAPFLAAEPGPMLSMLRSQTQSTPLVVTLLTDLAARVRDRVAYITRDEAGVWPPERTLQEGKGSCRDSAWVLVQLLRMHGIAARFASGYLVQIPEDEGAFSPELHAWAQAWLPGAGWIGMDATSGFLTTESHVLLAASPDPAGAAPLAGTSEPAEATLTTTMEVAPAP